MGLGPNSCQRECERECQSECQIECQNSCQMECQNVCLKRCQIECRNRCQIECLKECQVECQSICQTDCQIECQNTRMYIYTHILQHDAKIESFLLFPPLFGRPISIWFWVWHPSKNRIKQKIFCKILKAWVPNMMLQKENLGCAISSIWNWLLGALLLFEIDFYLILFAVNSPEVAWCLLCLLCLLCLRACCACCASCTCCYYCCCPSAALLLPCFPAAALACCLYAVKSSSCYVRNYVRIVCKDGDHSKKVICSARWNWSYPSLIKPRTNMLWSYIYMHTMSEFLFSWKRSMSWNRNRVQTQTLDKNSVFLQTISSKVGHDLRSA